MAHLNYLVACLPEQYQPIYGHPELSDLPSRGCEDRLVPILDTYDALATLLGRPLRVLDLGCAQGYFSLSLAALGADVLGVDFLEANIEVCKALLQERPAFKARFENGRIEEVLAKLKPYEFDLVLGLSVFHHVIHEKGIPPVKDAITKAAQVVGCILTETALRDEPLYWGPSQPEDPRELFSEVAFLHRLAEHSTHLCDAPRPMFVASNRYWVLDGEAQKILSWKSEPHDLAQGSHLDSRRYYFSERYLLKWYRIDCGRGEYNRQEWSREVEFLRDAPFEFPAPKFHSAGSNASEAWSVMERVSGALLSQLLADGEHVNVRRVLDDLLGVACMLERDGLYHNDIRTWNVLIRDDGAAVLIDYGSVVSTPQDCVWPHNIYFAFFIFLYELTTGLVEPPFPFRTVAISPSRLPPPYDLLLRRLWKVPTDRWSFALIREVLESNGENSAEATALIQPTEVWSAAVELLLQELKLQQQQMSAVAAHCEAVANNAAIQAAAASAIALSCEANNGIETKADNWQQQAQLWQQKSNQWRDQVIALHASTSWRITGPIRALKRLVHGTQPLKQFKDYRRKIVLRDQGSRFLAHACLYVHRRPALKSLVSWWCGLFTAELGRGGPLNRDSDFDPAPTQRSEFFPLPERTRHIYTALRAAIDRASERRN